MDIASSFSDDFECADGRIWLNCAHQGPLPKSAITTAIEAVHQKALPHLISPSSFDEIPSRLRAEIGHLLERPQEEIVLGNSTSYGAHIIANGMTWKEGDEVLLVKGDFPATNLPWIELRKQGVIVRFIDPTNGLSLEPGDVLQQISRRTRLLCVSWVNSFTGWRIDLENIGRICRENGVLFVLNGSQGIGVLPIDLTAASVDALFCCGYKWLCGPYGTGFLWLSPTLNRILELNHTHWSAVRNWDYEVNESFRPVTTASSRFDVFCTANFLSFAPWTTAIEYLNRITVESVWRHDLALINELVSGIDTTRYKILSPTVPDRISAIVVVSHNDALRNVQIQRCLGDRGIDIAVRKSRLRLSPHLYNTSDQLRIVLRELNALA